MHEFCRKTCREGTVAERCVFWSICQLCNVSAELELKFNLARSIFPRLSICLYKFIHVQPFAHISFCP
jgi:hypothetical protein